MCVRAGVCMTDVLLQSTKDTEPNVHQMTCVPKVNNMAVWCPAAIKFHSLFVFSKKKNGFGAQHIDERCAKKRR